MLKNINEACGRELASAADFFGVVLVLLELEALPSLAAPIGIQAPELEVPIH
jgi:hypothetical protein